MPSLIEIKKALDNAKAIGKELVLMYSELEYCEDTDNEIETRRPLRVISVDYPSINSKGDTTSGKVMCKSLKNFNYVIYGNDLDCIASMSLMYKNQIKKYEIVTQDKTPTSNKHNFVGVELEFISKLSRGAIEKLLVENDLEKYCQVKGDGSIYPTEDFPNAHEICVLATEYMLPKVIDKLCSLLKGNSKVNTSCGMHVHLDMRRRNKTAAYANLFKMQGLLYSMVPTSRANNDYCEPEREYTEFTDSYHNDNRYVGINTEAWRKHRTIEVRIHSGSLNADKINNWVKLLTRIVKMPSSSADNTEGIILRDWKLVKRMLKLHKGSLHDYVIERLKKHNKVVGLRLEGVV